MPALHIQFLLCSSVLFVVAPIQNHGQVELSLDTDSPHPPAATIRRYHSPPFQNAHDILVGVMCIIAQLRSSREQRKPPLPPAPVATQKHSRIGAFQNYLYVIMQEVGWQGQSPGRIETWGNIFSCFALFFPSPLLLVVEPRDLDGLTRDTIVYNAALPYRNPIFQILGLAPLSIHLAWPKSRFVPKKYQDPRLATQKDKESDKFTSPWPTSTVAEKWTDIFTFLPEKKRKRE